MRDRTRRERNVRRGVTAVEVTAGVALFLLTFHSVANAVCRKIFGYPLEGTTEYVGMWYLPFVAFLGIVLAQRRRQHIEVRLVFDRIPRANQLELQLFSHVVTLVLVLAMAWFTGAQALHNAAIGLTAGLMGVIVWPATFLPPICFAVLAVQILVSAVRTVRTWRLPDELDDSGRDLESAVIGEAASPATTGAKA